MKKPLPDFNFPGNRICSLPDGWAWGPLSREQCRRIDKAAEEDAGMLAILLMENAARAAAEEAYWMLREQTDDISYSRVVVFCGGGNNGGDGYALARHLHNACI